MAAGFELGWLEKSLSYLFLFRESSRFNNFIISSESSECQISKI